MNADTQPVCRIIAGSNGAGKTTFALKYLPEVAHCRAFVNADLIAAGLSPLAPEQQLLAASRLFLNLFEWYAGSVYYTRCFLNSAETPQLVFVQQGEARTVLQPELFEQQLSKAK